MSDVLVRVSGSCGKITLNRPRALNALTLEMVNIMHTALTTWANDVSIQFVLVDGAGERGLCAGGDIRAMYNAVVANRPELATVFFRNEYRLNYLISRYPKPYVVLMDGIVMGGGIGISAHASHRIVTERSELAMPETAIGFVPDVGGTHLLGTAPDELGTYLALTGSRIGAADAIFCRLADTMVLSEDLSILTSHLEKCESLAAVDEAIQAYTTQPPRGMTVEQRAWISKCFAANTVEEIFLALAQEVNPEARDALLELQNKSPTSLKVTLAALRNARSFNDLASCLQQEYRLAQSCLREHDFLEGVRAAIIDKDHAPKWRPDRLDRVTEEDVRRYFAESRVGNLDLTF
ncbi:enoyl-CoA hydratase/isomerase family protein [Tunturiibacter lichenicola]|uniref:enoyl-CoA hydratase/isomerase family protein n=1 Tax=Tunturiibacter lichenicola TaxID=2051959 RepID=UPI0021B2BFCE|nr:enoyl-CoA hydratase/isomerase family protein [Edaphobacter lichenicola]